MTEPTAETRTVNAADIALAKDRLRGTGAWNGQGLIVHLALTSRRDPERQWMQPLADALQRIVDADEDGVEVGLSGSDVQTLDGLAVYSDAFHAAIAAGHAAAAE